jgi:hypothetical protein
VGSTPYSSFGRPATALSPMFGIGSVRPAHDFRRLFRVPLRYVIAEHLGRLDHVVVHADHDEIVGVHGHHPVITWTSL